MRFLYVSGITWPSWALMAHNCGILYFDNKNRLYAHTMRGDVLVREGDYIVKSAEGGLEIVSAEDKA